MEILEQVIFKVKKRKGDQRVILEPSDHMPPSVVTTVTVVAIYRKIFIILFVDFYFIISPCLILSLRSLRAAFLSDFSLTHLQPK
jgi:hypothetical protein